MPRRDTAPLGAPCWIDLFSSDTDAARAFYGAVFGWSAEDAGEEYGGYITFSKDGVKVAGCMRNDGSAGSSDGWNTYLATDDATKTTAIAVEHGATVLVEPMQLMDLGSMAVVADPAGAAVSIWQPAVHKGFGVLAEAGTPAWFELHTSGYDSVVAFYRDVFDWDTHTMSDTADFRYTTLGQGDGSLAGIVDASADPDPLRGWLVYFAVEDTDAAVALIAAAGGSVTHEAANSPFGRHVRVIDPTGAAFTIIGPNT